MVQVWEKIAFTWGDDLVTPVDLPGYSTSFGGYTVPVYIPWAQPWLYPDTREEFIVGSPGIYFANGGISQVALPSYSSAVTHPTPNSTDLNYRYPTFFASVAAISLTPPDEPVPPLSTITRFDAWTQQTKEYSILPYVWRLVEVSGPLIPIEVSISALTPSLTEGTSGTQTITFQVTRTGDLTVPVSFDWEAVNFDPMGGFRVPGAANYFDYNLVNPATAASITFQPGETTKDIQIAVLGDTMPELNERVIIKISSTAAEVSIDTAQTILVNDDGPYTEQSIIQWALRQATLNAMQGGKTLDGFNNAVLDCDGITEDAWNFINSNRAWDSQDVTLRNAEYYLYGHSVATKSSIDGIAVAIAAGPYDLIKSVMGQVYQEDPNSPNSPAGGAIWALRGVLDGLQGNLRTDQALFNSFLQGDFGPKDSPVITLDGHLAGATIFRDSNGNELFDSGEASTTTDSNGFSTLQIGTGSLIAFGGTDVSTGLPFNGQFSAPDGSFVVTPLTTLLNNLQPDPLAGQKILTSLGLSQSLDLLTLDPIAAATAGDLTAAAAAVAGAKVYDTVYLVASAMAGAGGSFGNSLRDAFSALATAINSPGINLNDEAAITSLVASVSLTEHLTLPSGVPEAIAAVVAASNTALDHVLETAADGNARLQRTAAIQLVILGAASDAVKDLVEHPDNGQNLVDAFTGINLEAAIADALNHLPGSHVPTDINLTNVALAENSENSTVGGTLSAIDPDSGETFTFSLTDNAGGLFGINGTNLIVTGALDYEASVSHNVTVRVTDAAGNTFDKTFTIATTDVNEAPVTVAQVSTVAEDGPTFSRDLLNGTSDPDQGNQLSVADLDTTVTSASNRLLALGVDYTLTGSTFALTAAGFPKFNSLSVTQSDEFVFHFNISDGILETANTLTVTVDGANDAPSVANQTSSQAATAGAAYSFTLPGNTFNDVDNGDHLTLSASALPAWLSFDAATGRLSGTPSASDVGGFDINVTATDTGGLAASETIHFTVGAGATQNHSPVISSNGGGNSASVIITDHSKYVATLHADDQDAGTSLTYSIAGGKNAKLFAIDPATGVLSFKSYPDDHRTYQVTVEASDGNLTDTQQIDVSVGNGLFMKGHAGEVDTFVFTSHFGLEIVKGFDATGPNQDVLELDHSLFHGADPNASASSMFELVKDHSFQLGRDVVIVTDTHEVIDLQNVRLSQLSADCFHII
ncbi:putative Ig domain-containing protein [Reyranella soli]|uniref:Cadherin domain-containing protein n=1 Tax=Reyranella soli TaxID=1230389 RepID=A0A512NQ11_9HYPH|nr:putative Ig domain-containing protein [Reyranella soli]GEP61038.1 hypothetical protein RSO01_82040 [Reyranella soli]